MNIIIIAIILNIIGTIFSTCIGIIYFYGGYYKMTISYIILFLLNLFFVILNWSRL